MQKIVSYIKNFDSRKAFRITNARILSQIFFFAIFTFSIWATWTSRLGGYPVSRILEMDPLVMIATMLSTGYVYRYLGWGILVLALTLLFGRVFCNWICPYGTLHQFIGWLFNIGNAKSRIDENRYRGIYFLKYGILTVFLLMASMGALQIGLLDPICLMYRTFATVVSPAADMAIDRVSLTANGMALDTVWLDNLKF
ncbi:MAG TPA: 4Fe-4S binding protein, partial [Candidatus Hydrogenedentes bacterium]|nr:4Fe-4S binding protein [Candidatus Hydrogenedentota bacterium]